MQKIIKKKKMKEKKKYITRRHKIMPYNVSMHQCRHLWTTLALISRSLVGSAEERSSSEPFYQIRFIKKTNDSEGRVICH